MIRASLPFACLCVTGGKQLGQCVALWPVYAIAAGCDGPHSFFQCHHAGRAVCPQSARHTNPTSLVRVNVYGAHTWGINLAEAGCLTAQQEVGAEQAVWNVLLTPTPPHAQPRADHHRRPKACGGEALGAAQAEEQLRVRGQVGQLRGGQEHLHAA